MILLRPFFLLLIGSYAEWLLIDKTFTGSTIDGKQWTHIKQCNTNPLQYAEMNYYYQGPFEQYFYHKGFQVAIIFDVFQDGAASTTSNAHCYTYGPYIWDPYYTSSNLTSKSNRICTGGSDYPFDFKTITSIISITADYFYYHFHFYDARSTSIYIGFRNIMFYVNACFPRCLTCSGILNNQCTTCYYSATQNGQCNCHPYHQFAMTSIGCLQECPRGYLSNFDFICIPDNRIQAYTQYFTSNVISTSNSPQYYPFIFIQDPLNVNNRNLIGTDCKYGYNFVGSLHFNEGVQLQLNQINALRFIRIRMTIFLFNLQTDSTISILSDNILQSQIRRTRSNYYFINSTIINTDILQSSACNEITFRFETIYKTSSLNPNILIQGSLNSLSESWGFFNVTIDSGLCQANCYICSDITTCTQCKSGYQFYRNGCIQSCPIHSSNCVDYQDEFKYSRYLAKGFYNLNMTLDDISYFFDSVTNSGSNFLTGQKFGFFPDKFVLGGPMVWYNAAYLKTFTIQQPHYAISIRFNLTFGDEYPGQFYYFIESTQYGPFTLPTSGGGQNLVGRTQLEITKFFYKNRPHTQNTLSIKFQCVAPASFDIRDGFCAISEYFIVVHYCPPFCLVCSDSNTCTTWQSGHFNSNCYTNQYLSLDQISQEYSCKDCNPLMCFPYSFLDNDCVSCTYQTQALPSFYYLSGSNYIRCNKYCENCYGPSSSDCASCVSEFHRIIQNNQCVCQIGYYDDGHNLPCKPICGDQLIVDGEDCDDGNFNPFDGCDQCMFACGEMCSICVQGICESDNNEYIFGNNCCLQEVNDIIQVYNQNEDYSQYLCQIHCYICYFGLCELCNQGFQNQNGFCYEINNQKDNKLSKLEYYFSEYFCQPNCNICYFGVCELCNDDLENINGVCQEINISFISFIFLLKFNILEEQDIKKTYLQYRSEHSKNFCPSNCLVCYEGLCLQCNSASGYGYLDIESNSCQPICGDGKVSVDEECDDGSIILHHECFNCKNQCSNKCELCIFDKCTQCNYGYYLHENMNKCISYCGDQLIASNEDCDDGNQDLSDGCVDCKFVCHQQCTTCVDGRCYQCSGLGWKLNQVTKNCETVCGDKFVTGNEQCDDGNDFSEDGCYECAFECQKECEECKKGSCSRCIKGWKIDDKQMCFPFCGDSYVLPGHEECDDGNETPYDGCFQCKYQCQEQCTDCQKGICYECKVTGWDIYNHICFPVCGDGIVINGYEQCDDSNDEQYDGCDSCFYQCEQLCTSCQLGVCLECNHLGWIITNNKCTPYCGDGLIKGYEQCDDMNTDENDGCYECKFKCDEYCIDCQEGICFQCEIGRRILQSKLNRCETECGDGIYVQLTEQCDDGNDYNKDGCNAKCQIENDWTCINTVNKISTCFYSQEPEIVLTLVTKTPSNIEVVNLAFSQQMKRTANISGDILNYVIANITNMQSDQYLISKEINQQIATDEITDVLITLTIEFYQSVDDPILNVTIRDDPFVSQYGQGLMKNDDLLTLLTPPQASDSTKSLALSTQQFNKTVIYILVALSSLCLITGSSDLFWNLLDQLQYLSYIKYINIDFPLNLNIYFEVFKMITISPLLQALKIDQLFGMLDGDREYNILTQGKLLQDGINAYFWVNFQSFFFCIISSLLVYLVTKQLCLFLYKIRLSPYFRLNFTISNWFHKLRKTCKKQTRQFFYNGILRVIMSNWYDLSFAVIIQLAYSGSDDNVIRINYYMAMFALILQFGTIIFILERIFAVISGASLIRKKKYETLFQDIIQSQNIWVMQYNAILLLKKQIFIIMIVFMQQQGPLQALCITILQFYFLIYLIINKPLCNSFEYYKAIITEIILVFNAFTFLLYAYQGELSLNNSLITNLGWLHIFSFTMILGLSCIFDFIQQSQLLIVKVQKLYKKQQPVQSTMPFGIIDSRILNRFF